jgi:hypothetical protein
MLEILMAMVIVFCGALAANIVYDAYIYPFIYDLFSDRDDESYPPDLFDGWDWYAMQPTHQ